MVKNFEEFDKNLSIRQNIFHQFLRNPLEHGTAILSLALQIINLKRVAGIAKESKEQSSL